MTPRGFRAILPLVAMLGMLAGCATSHHKPSDQGLDYHYRMGMAHLQDHQLQDALIQFRAAQRVDGKSEKVLYALGHTYFEQGNYEAARTAMEQILTRNAENGEALNYLGKIHIKRGDTDRAIEAFERAAALPDYRTPHLALHNLGQIHQMAGRYDQAEKAYLDAIHRVPEYYPARADLAKMYLDQKRWNEAAEQWRIFVDLVPNLFEGQYYLGRAYLGVGKTELARRALFSFVSKAGPDHPLMPDAQALLGDLHDTP